MAHLNHINISIDNPCGEDFSAMDKTEKGNYCASCKTEVIDFTKMTDAQVLNYLQSKNFNVPCGRFRTNQLGREILNPMPEPFINWKKWRGAFYALFLLPLSFFKVSGQSKVKVKQELSGNNAMENVKSHSVVFEIVDSVGTKLHNVSVELAPKNASLEMSLDGTYKYDFTEVELNQRFELAITSWDYEEPQIFEFIPKNYLFAPLRIIYNAEWLTKDEGLVEVMLGQMHTTFNGPVDSHANCQNSLHNRSNLKIEPIEPPQIIYRKKSFFRRLFNKK